MSREMIDAIVGGDNLGAETEFKNAITQKIGDALEIRRAELAGAFVKNGVEASEED